MNNLSMRVVRLIRRIVFRAMFVVLLLALAGAGVGYLFLNRIVRRTVEQQTTVALNLQTTIESTQVSPFEGKAHFSAFRIASPPGFATPIMVDIPGADLVSGYRDLRSDPIHIQSIIFDKPVLVIESDGTAINLKRMIERMPHPKSQIRLTIDEIQISNATVVLRRMPGVSRELAIPVDSFKLEHISGKDGNGALIKEVMTQLLTTLAIHASKSPEVPPHLRALLSGDLGAIVRETIGGDVGRALSVLLDPATMKDPASLLGSLLPTSRPSARPPRAPRTAPSKLFDGLLNTPPPEE